MAKFIIGTPGGYEVEVTADTQDAAVAKARENWQSMPRIIAREGKTRVFQRANGQRYVVSPGFSSTDPAQVEQALLGMTGGQISRQSVDEAVIASAPAAARASQFVRGVPFVGSYADEAIGAVMGPEAAAGTRALQGAMERQRPGQTLGLNLAGGLTGAAGIAAAAPRAIAQGASAVMGSGSRGAQMARGLLGGAGAGAVEGAVYGAGEGTQGSRARAAQQGALVGGTVGGALGAAAPLVREGAQNVISLFRRSDIDQIAREFGISKNAARVIRDTFQMGGDVDDAMANLERAGREAMIADAGQAGQALLDAAATAGPRPAQDVSRAVGARAARSSAALSEAMDDVGGFSAAPETITSGIRAGSQRARSDAYSAAYSREIDWRSPAGERLYALLQSTPQEALAKAGRLKQMMRRDDFLPNYSDEFAPSVYTASGLTPEQQEVQSFFDRYAELQSERIAKRPMTRFMRERGGIDPSGPAAAELRARGITPQTHVGLFRRGGLKSLDNLPADEFDLDAVRLRGEATGYANPEDIYEALSEEGYGRAALNADDQAIADELAQMDAMLPAMEARRDAVQNAASAPDAVADILVPRTVEDVDLIKRALDDMARTGEGSGLLGGQTAYGKAAQDRSREIRDALAEAVPEYKQALASAADPIRRIQAVEFGAKMLERNVTRDAVREFVQNATPGERLSIKRGMRGQIEEVMANARSVVSDPNQDAREAVAALSQLNNRASREKMEILLGDDAPEFLRQLDETYSSLAMRANMAANSRTAIRQATQQGVQDITAPGVMGTAARGDPINASQRIVQAITGMTDEYTEQQRQRLYQDVAKALTEKRGPEARAALAVMQRAMDGQALTEEQSAQLANLLTSVLFSTATPATTRAMQE